MDILTALFTVAFVGGLSLLAHWGRKNRSAEITLFVTILFASFLVVLVAGIAAIAGASGGVAELNLPPELFVYSAVTFGLAGLVGLALCVPPLFRIVGRARAAADHGDFAYAIEDRPAEGGRAAGAFWSDPPTFFALWTFVIVLAYCVASLLFFVLAPKATDAGLAEVGRVSPFTVLFGEAPFAIVAFMGVGLGVRRGFRESVARLGYGPISVAQVGIVALFVVGALVLQRVASNLFALLQPDLFERVEGISAGLFDPGSLGPMAAVLFALLVGVGAGLGEETLYRGAIQPALGIPLTSVLFAAVHVQYGPSILLVFIFVLSLGLGILRKRINTTASLLAHAGYNATSVLLAYFLGGSV